MPTQALIFLILGLGFIAWATARARTVRPAGEKAVRYAAQPVHHAWYAALWCALPALVFIVAWDLVTPRLMTADVLEHPSARALPAAEIDRAAILAEAQGLADGDVDVAFNPVSETLVAPFRAARQTYDLLGMLAVFIFALVGAAFALKRVQPGFRARTRVERFSFAVLLGASLIAVLTTFGIVMSLLFESARFFALVSPVEFLFGTTWNPQSDTAGAATGSYGALPLFWGTAFIGAIIAMAVAVPLGLMSAIYLTQYATPTVRKWGKPLLELLAGVPTVVYGYFAALTIAPAFRDFAVMVGVPGASTESALAAGVVMGVMIIPFISSMSDDALAAVPRAMRDGALALGSTTSETIKQVLLPAALPGVVGGVLLAVSRAIGETMIVVMAAGLAANMTANPFASVTTVTAQIVQLLTGDQEFDSAKTLAAFALGLVLFMVTLGLNIVAIRTVKAYREAYE